MKNMTSLNAQIAAKKVIKSLRNSKQVNLGKILRESGYSYSVSRAPQNVTETQSFKEVMEPFIERMTKERDRLLTEAQLRDLSEEEYDTVITAIDKLTKNIQLLSGGATERQAIVLPSEITNKYDQ